MKNNRRAKKYLGTAFQKKLLFLVFTSAVIPAIVIAACMYYLIFNVLALEMVFPEIIASNLMPALHKANIVIVTAIPVILFIIWVAALGLSHRIAGPMYRLEKELEERIQGIKQGPIKLRKNDEFRSLVDKLNKLLCI